MGIDFGIRQVLGGRDAAEKIIGLAEQADVSLVVIGLRRRSAAGKPIMGSAAQQILLGARCPVRVVTSTA